MRNRSLFVFTILCFQIREPAQSQTLVGSQAMTRTLNNDTVSSWKWKADLRLRTQQETTAPADTRYSEKLRARLDVKVEVDSELKTEVRLATTKTNNSGNQTLGDNKDPGFSRRDFGIDLAYAEWKPLPFFRTVAGRVPQVHYRPGDSQILLDTDLALEGGAIIMEHSFDNHLSFFIDGGSAWLRENYDTYYSEKLTDNMLNWGQLGMTWKTQDSETTMGAGFFNYTALQNMKFVDVSVGGAARGNSEGSPGTYKNNYIPRQFFIESKQKVSGYQCTVFAEQLVNGETRDPNKGSWTGFSIAKINPKSPNSTFKSNTSSVYQNEWKIQLAYAYVESDVVPGVFTDSDFAGNATDSNGYVLNASWKVKKFFTIGLTQFLNHKKFGIEDAQYDRTHIDLGFEFSL